MQIVWNNKEPIYHQLHERLVELILDGVIAEGEALPSIREISSEQRINHITVSKALQILVDENLVEMRRGLGMFVVEGASEKLLQLEKDKFLTHEWPVISKKIQRLGLSSEELLKLVKEKAE